MPLASAPVAPDRLIDWKSDPLVLRFTSPGWYNLLLFKSCQV